MELFNLNIAALIVLGLALVLVGIGAARNGTARLAMLGLFLTLVGTIFGASAGLMGQAKPVSVAWLEPQVDEAVVISGHLMEDRGIYLTLLWDQQAPRLYVLPWDRKTAEQLQQALSEARESGTQAKMRRPFKDMTQREEPTFYAAPQPEPPAKEVPDAGVRLGAL